MRARILSNVDVLTAVPVFAGFLGYYVLCCFRAEWGGDFQIYCAGVAQLYRNWLHPAHEAMNAPGSQSTIYTPYLVAVAGLGRLLGVTPYRALQLAGAMNLTVYLLSIFYFLSRFSMHRRIAIPAACFVLTTLLLRWKHYGWSSETSLLALQFIQAYPSVLAWALAMFAFGLMEDLRRDLRPGRGLILVAALCLLLLSHAITASWVLGTLVLRALYVLAIDREWRFPAAIAAAVVAALAGATLWPYTSFLGQSGMASVKEPSTFGEHALLDFPNLYLLAIPCALWLLLRLRRHGFVILAFFATFAALAVWRALGISFGNRYSFFMAFWAHFLVAEVMAAGILVLARGRRAIDQAASAQPWLDRPLLALLIAAFVVAWQISPAWRQSRRTGITRLAPPGELWRRPSSHDQYYSQFGRLTEHLGHGDLVMMLVGRPVLDLASITGAAFLGSPNALRVPDVNVRQQALSTVFSPESDTPTRLAIARHYCANKLLLSSSRFALLPRMTEAFGAPIYRDAEYALFQTSVTRDGCP
jgi:hypothetical protein